MWIAGRRSEAGFPPVSSACCCRRVGVASEAGSNDQRSGIETDGKLMPWSLTDAPRLDGKIAIVTGATGGLGWETALGLAQQGAMTILAGRNPVKGADALARLTAQAPGSMARFELLDLASLDSVAMFAGRVTAAHPAVSVLVNNAGVMALPTRQVTADGFELQFGTNYLGHFALTARLLPQLLASSSARVVSVSSLAHRRARMDFGDPQAAQSYKPWTAYGQSKLAMLMFARELQRRATASGWPLRSIAAHPGWAVTDLIGNGPGAGKPGLKKAMMEGAFRVLGQSAARGALPILYAALAPEAEAGGYYGPNGFMEIKGEVGPSQVMPQAEDAGAGVQLWELSEQETGVRFELG